MMRPIDTAAVSRSSDRNGDGVSAGETWGRSPTSSAICEIRSEW